MEFHAHPCCALRFLLSPLLQAAFVCYREASACYREASPVPGHGVSLYAASLLTAITVPRVLLLCTIPTPFANQ